MNRVKSFSDSSVEYIIDLNELNCTCPDFLEERNNFNKNNPKRLCKHLIKEIIHTNYIDKNKDLNFFKSEIKDYFERKIGFAKNYIFQDLNKIRILYVCDSSWIKIYDELGNKGCYNGEKFACDSLNIDLTEVEYRFIKIDTDDTKDIIIKKIHTALEKYILINNIILNEFKIDAYSSLENNEFENINIYASIELNNNIIDIFKFSNADLDNGIYNEIAAYMWIDLIDVYNNLFANNKSHDNKKDKDDAMENDIKTKLKGLIGEEGFNYLEINSMESKQVDVLYNWGLKMFGLGQNIIADIEEVKFEGKLIVLNDGTYWEVDEYETDTSEMWDYGEKIIIIDDEMYKLDDMEKVNVTQTFF